MNNKLSVTIEPAQTEDLAEVLNLLTICQLPHDGLEQHINSAVVARTKAGIVGSAALEVYGSAALLRSVAVAPELQGQGLGRQLTRAALAMGQTRGVSHFYLLTETAGDFFPRFGFQVIERAQVPAPVQSSVEFTLVCPTSALVMALDLA